MFAITALMVVFILSLTLLLVDLRGRHDCLASVDLASQSGAVFHKGAVYTEQVFTSNKTALLRFALPFA